MTEHRSPTAVLVVESDRRVGRAVAEQLSADGYGVGLACTAEHARVLAAENAPQIALLGKLDSPFGALRLLEEIRTSGPDATWNPLLRAIVLGARTHELDVLRAFEAGADDFLSTSAGYLELRARLKAILRRGQAITPMARRISVGAIRIDLDAHAVRVDGATVELRRLEYELLVHLACEPERVFSKQELLDAVWGYGSQGATRTVDTHASRVRRKLACAGERHRVVNVRGVGYRLT